LSGIVNRTKSILTGRRGPPVWQRYADIAKLLRKGTVYSTTTTRAFRIAPAVLVATVAIAATLVPLGASGALVRFSGDLVAFVGLLAAGRFLLALAALDTGSSFEGMGASREVWYASLVEPALLLAFTGLTLATGSTSLSDMLGPPLDAARAHAGPALVLVAASVFVVLLAESSRVPFDDPATHLELTMVHEVMVLDHSGPDLALIEYAAGLKLALFAAVLTGVLWPPAHAAGPTALVALGAGLLLTAVAVGIVESVMARLRLTRVPQILVAASALASFGVILLLR
jgi:formate hydrogenlyase subunit 4